MAALVSLDWFKLLNIFLFFLNIIFLPESQIVIENMLKKDIKALIIYPSMFALVNNYHLYLHRNKGKTRRFFQENRELGEWLKPAVC
ncbi:hypothetical protein [Echinicola shivajiensis]|uniref:hypothetical protein n=1 Tax=Echinicola shivajiensis TaxID=1035916 RepID=UPI001BFC1D00|nr:hypothetical protein [Echinicola shivajiensis]